MFVLARARVLRLETQRAILRRTARSRLQQVEHKLIMAMAGVEVYRNFFATAALLIHIDSELT